MLFVVKQPKRLIYFFNFLVINNKQFINTIRPFSYCIKSTSQIRLCSAVQSKGFLVNYDRFRLILSRNKYDSRKKRQRKRYDEESDDEENEEEEEDDNDDDFVEKGTEIKTHTVKSLRIDSILKIGLGISRKKIEEAFYQNKIRVNGELVHKKSHNAKLNDEVDLIKGFCGNYSDSIVVGRVKILKVQQDPDTGSILLKVSKCKSLKINNYSDKNAWRESTVEE